MRYTMKFALLFNAVMAWLFVAANCNANTRSDLTKVQAGIDAGKAILNIFADDKFSTTVSKIGSIAGYLGPFFGAIGPAISLISLFLPSPQMQFMKKEFAKIDAKFDQVFVKLDEVKRLIEESSLKNHYFQHEQTILALSEELNNFLSASDNQTLGHYKRSFLVEYKSSYKQATYKLWRGMMKYSAMSYNIPRKAMSFTNNHRRRTLNIMKGVLNLILQGVKVELAYYKFQGNDWIYNHKKQYWEGKIKETLDHINSVEVEVKGKWYSQSGIDLDSMLSQYHGTSNSYFATALYNFLKDKYDWRDFHVVAYNPLYGGDKHWVKWCGGHHRFREYGRNVVVASVDKIYKAQDMWDAKRMLRKTTTRWRAVWNTHRNYEAKEIFKRFLPKTLSDGCLFDSAGVILKNEDVNHRAPSNRLAVVTNGAYKLHAFG